MIMNTQHKCALIIDDEPDIRELLEITLGRMQIQTYSAASVAEAKEQLKEREFDFCLTDMRLDDGDGLMVVEHIQQHYTQTPVAVITAHGNIDLAIESMKAGAFDFLSKPVDLTALRKLVNTALQTKQSSPKKPPKYLAIVGKSECIETLKKNIEKLSRSQAPIYIQGESGTGKELVARLIHALGPRHDKPFIAVNCGAIPRELMESEFFGHKRGSFTGATQDKIGLFQAAEGGVLFLDEVADLPLDMQVKLLRAIQEKSVRPIGAADEIPTDVRILSATHKNLEQEVQQNRFRQDLFYRLNVIQLSVPSLRERKSDIPLLSQHLLNKIASPHQTIRLSKCAMERLLQYDFPGNVRELENILERAYTLAEGDEILASDLQLNLNPPSRVNLQNSPAVPQKDNEGTINYAKLCNEYASIDDYLSEVEKTIIIKAMENTRWNRTLAAKQLGISFRSLRYRLQKLGFDDESE